MSLSIMTLSRMMPLAACGAVLLTGCHTVEGVGRDIQAVGTGISYVARDTNEQLFGGYGGWPQGTAEAGEPCDALGDELAGGSGLPPCPR